MPKRLVAIAASTLVVTIAATTVPSRATNYAKLEYRYQPTQSKCRNNAAACTNTLVTPQARRSAQALVPTGSVRFLRSPASTGTGPFLKNSFRRY